MLPGAVETEALADYLDSSRRPTSATRCAERTPAPQRHARRTSPRPCCLLASPAASWITGKLLEVDGGAEENLIPHDLPDLDPRTRLRGTPAGPTRSNGALT